MRYLLKIVDNAPWCPGCYIGKPERYCGYTVVAWAHHATRFRSRAYAARIMRGLMARQPERLPLQLSILRRKG